MGGKNGSRTGSSGRKVALVLLLCLGTLPGSADPGTEAPPDVAAPGPPAWTPERSADEALRELWRRGVALEESAELRQSAALYERIVAREPEGVHTYWRIARNYWRHAEALPLDDTQDRLDYYDKATSWARRGLERDPHCGECCLYQFVGETRAATTRGVLASVSGMGELSELLDRCLALPVTHVDNDWNREEANLYYAAGSFYRLVPDSAWMSLVSGARGDKHKAVAYMRRAAAITDDRIDYQVNLGAALLCLGGEQDEPALVSEGVAVLEEVPELPRRMPTDPIDVALAAQLIAQPERACGHSRSGWIDASLQP